MTSVGGHRFWVSLSYNSYDVFSALFLYMFLLVSPTLFAVCFVLCSRTLFFDILTFSSAITRPKSPSVSLNTICAESFAPCSGAVIVIVEGPAPVCKQHCRSIKMKNPRWDKNTKKTLLLLKPLEK